MKMVKIHWALLVKILLSNLGISEVWLQQNVDDIKAFLTIVKHRFFTIVMQIFNELSRAASTDKLHVY